MQTRIAPPGNRCRPPPRDRVMVTVPVIGCGHCPSGGLCGHCPSGGLWSLSLGVGGIVAPHCSLRVARGWGLSEASQFSLLRERRFAPFFLTQFLGAFNDNIFRNGLVILITFQGVRIAGMDAELLVNVAGALFI